MKDVTTFIRLFNSSFRRGRQKIGDGKTNAKRRAWEEWTDEKLLNETQKKRNSEKFNKITGREAINKAIKDTLERRKERSKQ